MTAIRTIAVHLVVMTIFTTTATAAPLSWFGTQASLSAWYANQMTSAGTAYVPPNSITNLPTTWYGPSSAPAANSIPSAPTATYAAVAPAVNSASAPVTLATQTVPAPTLTPVSASIVPQAVPTVDAFVNLGQGPYAEASTITVGNPQPWYTSPSAVSAFGGTPSAAQQASFADQVLSDVQHTFNISGMNISLTDDPNVPARHMMSVVSGASYGPNANAIGITDVGANGFGFIDKLSYAKSPDELAWAVAHNVSHELMHALGVGTHPDTTGNYLDAATASWSLLTDPNTKFSPAAVALMQSASNGTSVGTLGAQSLEDTLHGDHDGHGLGLEGAQILEAPVPEPATIMVWAASGLGAAFMARRRLARTPA